MAQQRLLRTCCVPAVGCDRLQSVIRIVADMGSATDVTTSPSRPPGTVTRPEALARGRFLGSIIAAGLAGFGVVFAVVRLDPSARLDVALTRTFQRIRDPRLKQLMTAVSWPGFPPQSRVIPFAIIGAWLSLGLRAEAATQALAAGGSGLATILKLIARRPRPVASQVTVVSAPLGGTSFPSGHVLTYMGTYGILAYLLAARIRPSVPRVAFVAAPISLIALVGPSRIYQGHHWATDVLASYLIGISYVAVVAAIYRHWLAERPGA
jgi:membrane-associated phospholipid phosphatase